MCTKIICMNYASEHPSWGDDLKGVVLACLLAGKGLQFLAALA